MSPKDLKKYRIYHPGTESMWGPVERPDANGQTETGWGWISLTNQIAWGDKCIFADERMLVEVKKFSPEAIILPV